MTGSEGLRMTPSEGLAMTKVCFCVVFRQPPKLAFGFWFREEKIIEEGRGIRPRPSLASHATNPISGMAEALSVVTAAT